MEELVSVEKELLKQVQPVIQKAKEIVIKSVDDVEKASKFLRRIKDAEIIIEDKRKSFTQPLNASLKEINKTFKEMKAPLVEAREMVSEDIIFFKRKEEERLAEEQRKRDEAKKILEEADIEVPEVPEVPEVENTIGSTRTVKRWTFEVEDISKVPIHYIKIDEVKVREAIRNDVRELPGLKIYQKESISIV
jgi:hypothetical protein